MPLEPATAVILRALDSAGASAMGSGTPEAARAFARANSGAARHDPSTLAQVGSIADSNIPGPGGELKVRLYRPASDGTHATVVYFHGGGFVIGDLDSHDDHCRMICRDVDAVVMAVEYRLAPEARFPKPFEDALAATRWAADNVAGLGGDPDRLAVAGDSAGGNLAAAVAVALAGSPIRIAAQMLVYPKIDFSDHPYPSRVDNASGYYFTAEMSHWFQNHYIDRDDYGDHRASVIAAEVDDQLAPAVIGVGEFDLLRDEVLAYAARLESGGVAVDAHCFDGLVHGFYGLARLSPASAQAIAVLNADFRTLLDATL